MRKNKSLTWEYKGSTYSVGEPLSSKDVDEGIYPIVWYKHKLYKVWRLSERVLIQDIYNENIFFWKSIDHVFHVVKGG